MSARRLAALLLSATLAVLPLAACSDDGGSDDATTTAPVDTQEVAPLSILVTNDDGYDAEGIGALVEGLSTLEGVEVTVVAPLEQQSGTGGQTSEDEPAVEGVTMPNGTVATAVDGFPADAVAVALDDEGIDADLVISGINEGQNLGPIVDVSGTIRAARAAAARGVPALAVSQGGGESISYDVAVGLVQDWVAEHRAELADGTAEATVASINVPTCAEGQPRGLVDVEPALAGNAGVGADCTSELAVEEVADDVSAFAVGFATLTDVPVDEIPGPDGGELAS